MSADITILLFLLLYSTGDGLQMMGPSAYTASIGSVAHIPCTFTADKLPADPKRFAVIWNLEGKKILSYDNNVASLDPRYSLDIERALNGNADLTISNTFLSDRGMYTCSVTDSPLEMNKEIRVEVSGDGLQMTGPSAYTGIAGSVTHIPCTFTAGNLPADPRYFEVFWYLEGKNILSYVNTVTPTDSRYSLDKDQALNGIADLTIANTFLSDSGVYKCSVNYSSFLMEKEITVDISAQPQLSIPNKSVQRNTENTLTCVVTGFFPKEIVVTWYKDGEILKNQQMEEPHKNDKGTYQVTSTVIIPPSDDDQNKTFSCRIQHVSLQDPLQENFQLTYQESLSPIGIGIVVGVAFAVIIIVAVIVTLWKKRTRTRASERPPNSSRDASVTFLADRGRQQVGDNQQSLEDREERQKLITNEGQIPDPEIGEITVPELIEGKNATLSSKLCNYNLGEHTVSWYVNVKSGGLISATFDGKKHPTIEKDEEFGDQNNHIAYLALQPVQKSDDGLEFILQVEIPNSKRVIGRSTGPIHVKGDYQAAFTPGKRKIKLDESKEKRKDQCAESPTANISAENNNHQPSGQQQICKPDDETLKEIYEEQPQCSVDVEKEDNADTSSILGSRDEEEFPNLDNREIEGFIQNSPLSPSAEQNNGNLSLKTEEDHKENQNLGSQKPDDEQPQCPVNMEKEESIT